MKKAGGVTSGFYSRNFGQRDKKNFEKRDPLGTKSITKRLSPVPGVHMLHPSSGPLGCRIWMDEMAAYVKADKSMVPGVHKIFTQEEPNYPEIEVPDDPAGEQLQNEVFMFKWKSEHKAATEMVASLVKNRISIMGDMERCMSDQSKDKVFDTENGRVARDTDDPLLFSQTIVATHFEAGDEEDDHFRDRIKELYTFGQEVGETIETYTKRFNAHVKSVEYGATMKGMEELVPNDEFRVDLYTEGFLYPYSEYRAAVKLKQLQKKDTIDEAKTAAKQYIETMREQGKLMRPDKHSVPVYAATAGGGARGYDRSDARGDERGGDRGGDRNGDRNGDRGGDRGDERGDRGPLCFKCDQPGHFAWQCPQKKNKRSQGPKGSSAWGNDREKLVDEAIKSSKSETGSGSQKKK